MALRSIKARYIFILEEGMAALSQHIRAVIHGNMTDVAYLGN